jgi:hypothetical protein
MGINKKEAESPKQPAAVTRKEYLVVYAKNFGSGVVQAGKTVKLNEKAAIFNLDKGIIKKI